VRLRRPPPAEPRGGRRGVALVIVLAAISILTVLLAELQDEASSESAAAIADRDALKAEYAARSAVNLSRLLIATEPTIRTALAPILMMALGGSTQIPVWEFANQVLGAFNDKAGSDEFASLSGFDISGGRNLGMNGARFEVSVVDEDSKINLNVAARGDAITQNRMGMELLGLMAGDQYNPLFENRDPDGQFSDRMAICSALVDWADSDENMYTCDPRNAQAQATTAEDTFYQMLRSPYRRKNAAYDSLEELHLVRGVSEDFFATFVDPDPGNPKKRTMTVWGQGAINVNNANAQTLLSVVCGFAVANPPQPLCADPEQQARFLMAVNMLRSFTAGAPLFSSPRAFVRAMKGEGPMGRILKEMVGIMPVVFFSDAEVQKAISTESKMFSIYADGIVPGYRRTTRVRIHAVVDFRNAPPPGFGFAGIPVAGASGSAAGMAGLPGMPPGMPPAGFMTGAGATRSTAPSGATPGAAGAEGIPGALAPNPGGTIIYYRIE
jgi:general secretion pathway protein K